MGGVAGVTTSRASSAPDWRKAIAVIAGCGLAVTLAGCARPDGTTTTATTVAASTPAPSPTLTTTTTPTAATTPTSTPTATPSESTATPSGKPGVKATGSMSLYAEVSRTMAGTCQVVAGVPTLTLADHKNGFFQTVDVMVRLASGRKAVASLTAELGEDSETITRRITYDAAKPAKGTSAKLTVSGNTYKLSGKGQNFEDGRSAGTIPYAITATCAGSGW